MFITLICDEIAQVHLNIGNLKRKIGYTKDDDMFKNSDIIPLNEIVTH